MNAQYKEFSNLAAKEFFQDQAVRVIEPFQPDRQTIEDISVIHDYEPSNDGVRLYGNQQSTLLVDDVPFSAYWQLKEKKFIFHPMVWGRPQSPINFEKQQKMKLQSV